MRGIEFSGLLAGICGEILDQILIDETKNIIVLTTVSGNIFDESYKFNNCFRSICWSAA